MHEDAEAAHPFAAESTQPFGLNADRGRCELSQAQSSARRVRESIQAFRFALVAKCYSITRDGTRQFGS
jgi:hypothetical protein